MGGRSLRCAVVWPAWVVGLLVMAPAPVGAHEPGLSRFSGFGGSHVLLVEGAPKPSFSPFHEVGVLVGATQVEVTSEPRAEAYGATVGFGGLVAPGYRGQCKANYPGRQQQDKCGLPARQPSAATAPGVGVMNDLDLSPGVASRPPDPEPRGEARFSTVYVQASGGDQPDGTQARGKSEAAYLTTVTDLVRIRASTSESRSFVEDGAVRSVTSSRAEDVNVAGILHIETLETQAEAVHPGDAGKAQGAARTEILGMKVAGVALDLGPKGLMLQGQPLALAPKAIAGPVLAALASRNMTIEPLPAARVTTDVATGALEASTAGLRVVLSTWRGDPVQLILGQAQVRVTAVPAVEEAPPPPPVVVPAMPPAPAPVTAPPPAVVVSPPPAPLPRVLPVVAAEAPEPVAAPIAPRPPPSDIGSPRPAPSTSLAVVTYLVVLGFAAVGTVFAIGGTASQ
jgi:hypothetical protein